MARICLINPRFPTSFWGLDHGLPLVGKRANMPVLALPVLTLTLLTAGVFLRFVRAAMLETLREPFVRTARALGVGEGRLLLQPG